MASNPEKKADDRRFEEHRDQDPSSIADLLPDGMSGDIIVSKFSGWGSLVTIIPLLDAIKNRFPESGIILLTHRKNEEFAKILPQITRTILFSNPGLGHFLKSPLQFWKKAIKEKSCEDKSNDPVGFFEESGGFFGKTQFLVPVEQKGCFQKEEDGKGICPMPYP